MTELRRAAEDYLAMRRALGFKLTTQGRQLMSFVDYCESRGSDRIASDLALEWATTTRSGGVNWAAASMSAAISPGEYR